MDEAEADRYREELLVLVEGFEYERCGECGQDVHMHTFGPDPLGKPHAYCMTGDCPHWTTKGGNMNGHVAVTAVMVRRFESDRAMRYNVDVPAPTGGGRLVESHREVPYITACDLVALHTGLTARKASEVLELAALIYDDGRSVTV